MTADELVDAYYEKIFKLCLFYLRNEPEAEEILQEIFIKVLKKQSSFKGEAGIYTWIYRLAVNTLLNHIRRKKIVEFLSLEGERESDSPGPAHLAESEQEQQYQLEVLERCIKNLSNREKTAFYFYHYDGLKQKEIAEVMNTSVSAVESLIHKAMKKLKGCVKD